MSLKVAIKAAARMESCALGETYSQWTLFKVSTKGGGNIGVAVRFGVGMYLIPIYTLPITGIFYFVWQFITYIILMSPPGPTPTDGQAESQADKRRAISDITLISVWNSSNPWTAMVPLLKYTWRMLFTVKDTAAGELGVIVLLLTAASTLSNLGSSILVLDWCDDMERLINAAFVSSINIFRDATMSRKPSGLSNPANPARNLTEGAGDFIPYSREVTLLLTPTVIAIPAAFLLLCCIRGALWLAKTTFREHEVFKTFDQRTINLEAVQGYRIYDEKKRGSSGEWKGKGERIPYIAINSSPSQSRDSHDFSNSTGESKASVNGPEVRVEPVREGEEVSDWEVV